MTFQEKTEKATRLMEKHGLGADWRLSIQNLSNPNLFQRNGKACDDLMGFCDSEKKVLYIDSLLSDRHFRQTVLHEIAHALTPNDPGHGEEWIKKAGEIGCTLTHRLPYSMALR